MPDIPFNPNPTVAPSGASGVFQSIAPNPNAFGADVAGATSRLGGALDRAGEQQAQTAIMFQKQYNETATDQANVAFDGNARTATGDFKQLRGAAAMDAMPDMVQRIEQMRVDARGALKNPEQQRMFDYMSRRAAKGYLDSVDNHARTEFKVWQGDTATGGIANEINKAQDFAPNSAAFATSLGNIKIQTDKLSALKGIDPNSDYGKAQVAHYQGEAWDATLTSLMAHDPDQAREVFDANADQIDARHRGSLDAKITQHQYMAMVRDDARIRRDDAVAAKEQQATQTSNLAKYTADTLQGKGPSAFQLGELVRTQTISPHAVDFILALSKRKSAGAEEDNALALVDLHQRLRDGNLADSDVTDAVKAGRLKGATGASLIDAMAARDKRGESGLDKANFNELKTELSGHAIEQGIIRDPAMLADQTALWGAAQNEWIQRVMVKGENSSAVLADMRPRYVKTPQVPAAWPMPRMGAVASNADVGAVWAKTKAAQAAGALTQSQVDGEAQLLQRYKSFYDAQAVRQAAAKAAKPTTGPTAKVRGQVAGEQ